MSALSFNPNCGTCGGLNSRGYCNYTACRFSVTKTTIITNKPPITNADRIRAMSDEELADCFSSIAEEAVKSGGKIKSSCWLDWLRREVATDG